MSKPPSTAEVATRMLAAYHGGDMATVLALGEPVAQAGDADDTVLLLLGAAQQAQRKLDAALASFRRLVDLPVTLPSEPNPSPAQQSLF